MDGIPTYNFAVAVDDHLMEITHVLRGDDHISNTPKQMMIYEAFGWDIPQFGHMTLIVNESRKKLSKRDESIIQFIEQYKELGYLPEAIFNFYCTTRLVASRRRRNLLSRRVYQNVSMQLVYQNHLHYLILKN